MAFSAKEENNPQAPIQLEVVSPALYQAIQELLHASKAPMSIGELIETLEDHLEGTLAETVKDATGVDAPFPQGVEVHIVAENDESEDDDEPDPVEGFRQAWHDVMTENTHPASILWDDNFWNDADAECAE